MKKISKPLSSTWSNSCVNRGHGQLIDSLRRKKAWEQKMGSLEVKYADASFADAKLDAIINCTVEVCCCDV